LPHGDPPLDAGPELTEALNTATALAARAYAAARPQPCAAV